MTEETRRKPARIGAVAWGAFLFLLTSWPRPPRVPMVSDIPNFDKIGHFGLYAIEAGLLYASVSWPGRPRFSLGRALAIVGAMAVWGVVDETHQTWIPERSMEGEDVLADVAGAAGGAIVASMLSGKKADPSLPQEDTARDSARRVTS